MNNSIAITIHPSPSSDAEYLSVSDALLQVLDAVHALEDVEGSADKDRDIVWRLVEAHTNSPPFTVVLEPFGKDPEIPIDRTANLVTERYLEALAELMTGRVPQWIIGKSKSFEKLFKRNIDSVGFTDISVPDHRNVTISPSAANRAVNALENLVRKSALDLSRTEYGSVEGTVTGIVNHNGKPALNIVESFSGNKVKCTIPDDLAEQIGPDRVWSDVWTSKDVRIRGEISYANDGRIKIIKAMDISDIQWSEIPLSALEKVDLLQGKAVRKHLDDIWESNGD